MMNVINQKNNPQNPISTDHVFDFNSFENRFEVFKLSLSNQINIHQYEQIKNDIQENASKYVYDVLKHASKEEHPKILDQLYDLSGMRKRDFNKVIKSQRQQLKRDQIEESNISIIRYDPFTMIPRDLFLSLTSKLAADFYYTGSNLIQEYINEEGNAAVRVIIKTELSGYLMERVVIERQRNGDTYFAPIKPQEVTDLMHCHELLSKNLRPLKFYTKIPGFNENFQIYKPGYCQRTKTLYYGDRIDIGCNDAIFKEFMNMFSFESILDSDRFQAYILLLPLRYYLHCNFPILAIIGPSGVGKTTLTNCIASLFNGGDYIDVASTRQEEFKKSIAAAIRSGESLISLDNQILSNRFEALDSLATQKKLSFRLLGSNDLITRPYNDLILMMTVNGGHFTVDQQRRSITLGLNFDFEAKKQNLSDIREDIIPFVKENRSKLLGHIFWMLQETADNTNIFQNGRKKGWKQLSSELIQYWNNRPISLNSNTFYSFCFKKFFVKMYKREQNIDTGAIANQILGKLYKKREAVEYAGNLYYIEVQNKEFILIPVADQPKDLANDEERESPFYYSDLPF